MAPVTPGTDGLKTPPPSADPAAPLADYFFISGIESGQVYNERAEPAASPVEAIIEEDRALETSNTGPRPATPVASPTDPLHSRSRYSFEARKSVGSIVTAVDSNRHPASASNRSSATIHAPKTDSLALNDDAFEEALKQFASERDSFLEDIQVSAGVVANPTQKKTRPKTVRIAPDEEAMGGGGGGGSRLSGGVAGVRRRLSTMNSMKRQSSGVSRQSSVRTSRRLSGYNSVIPSPQPFHSTPDMHPLKRRYEPVLLDRYPSKSVVEETKRRSPFPDYVPMFAFPNDVHVVSADERPRSTWHGFAMTNQDGSKLYGICVILWLALNQPASDALERQCEEWRRVNMSDEERELASSLGERLSGERAKLSRLLAELPTVASGSHARDKLEDEIGAVEEKIGLMTDLLRPVRHGAASKIDGLTEGDTGFWIPRAYGVLGRDQGLTSFWKEWLKSIVVPMTNGAILHVPPSSPRVGVWQPLERYVVNLCVEALSPITSITQVEVAVRDLRLYARKEAINELPGSRNTDLYALFRCLTIPTIVTLVEFALSESRIILLSHHTAMLQLASAALTSLLYPLKWTGVLIPVLPARLIQALEAPCPYIAGVEKRYDRLEVPDDDFCLVDLDENSIESTGPPIAIPRPQRRKLISLLQVAAPHHNRFGVPTGPPQYAIETFPHDAFSSENPQVFTPEAVPPTLANYVSESSSTFGKSPGLSSRSSTVYNAFLHSRVDWLPRSSDRPSTGSTGTTNTSHSSGNSPPSPVAPSPVSPTFPTTPISRNDSGHQLQASLREKRSGHFASDGLGGRRNSTFGFDRIGTMRRPSQPVMGHHSTPSTSTLGNGTAQSTYAPSVYAQSTLAASTIMPQVLLQPVRDNETTKWVEGHCFNRRKDVKSTCGICDERCDDEMFKCTGCGLTVHVRCTPAVSLVCPIAFNADQVRAAFVRCFASLFYTYRRYLHPASGERRKAGLTYHFNMDQFLRSVPHGDSEYMRMLRQTQAFNEFIHEREAARADDPAVRLFDEIVLSKRHRSRAAALFSSASTKKSATSFLADTADHLWRSAAATPPTVSRDRAAVTGRAPAKLDPALMKEPRSIQGAPRLHPVRAKRKPVASMLGLPAQSAEP